MAAVDKFSLMFREINHQLKTYEAILAIVGALYVGKTSYIIARNLLIGLRVHILCKFRKQNFRKYGKWAVITGATDGIGKAYAMELAKHGMSIVLVSRSMDKLQSVANEIQQKFKVETMVIQADFSRGKDIYENLKTSLEDKEIGVLVNNVGSMYDYPSMFLQVPEQKLWDLIFLNMASVTFLTYMVMPQMVQRKKGVVINVSSIATFFPMPLMAGYSASKVYVDWLTRALQFEYSGSGVTIQSLVPSYISTKMVSWGSVLQHKNFMTPDATSFVKSALQTVGVANRTTGYWSHGLQYWFYQHVPEKMWQFTCYLMMKMIDTHEKAK